MVDSGLRQFWNSVKLPRSVASRVPDPSSMAPSRLERLWNAIDPPPPVGVRGAIVSKRQTLRQRIMLWGMVAVVLVGAGAAEAHFYTTSERARAEGVFQDGMRFMITGDYEAAAERFTDAVRIWPLADGYLQRGYASRGLNQLDAAIEDYQQAIREDPNMVTAYIALGVAYQEQGDLPRAVNDFTLAIHLKANADLYYQRGQVYELLGQHEQAIQDYALAMKNLPDAAYIYRARAVSLEAMGDSAGAERDRRTAMQFKNH